MSEDDIKYRDVIKMLKGLPGVNAPKNFETMLMSRIKAGKTEAPLSLWERIFLPSRLIPSAALAVTAVIILFVMNINSDEIENPLLVEPRVREDIYANTRDISFEDKYSSPVPKTLEKNKANEIKKEEKSKSLFFDEIESDAEKSLITEDTNIIELDIEELLSKRNKAGFSMESSVMAVSFIDKKGLNFKQINLNEEERIALNQLKERMKSLFKKGKN
jgi:hypothetical protein